MTTADEIADIIADYLDGGYDEDLDRKMGASSDIADGLTINVYPVNDDPTPVETFEVHVLRVYDGRVVPGVSAN